MCTDFVSVFHIYQPANQTHVRGRDSFHFCITSHMSFLTLDRVSKQKHPAVKRFAAAGTIDWENDRMPLNQVYETAKLLSQEDMKTGMYDTVLHVIDLLALQRQIEMDLFKQAM